MNHRRRAGAIFRAPKGRQLPESGESSDDKGTAVAYRQTEAVTLRVPIRVLWLSLVAALTIAMISLTGMSAAQADAYPIICPDGTIIYSGACPAMPPTVTSATAPAQLKGSPFVVTFSRPVKGVSTDQLSVMQVGLADIAGVVACRDDLQAAVDCSAGPVTTALFTPTSALIAGEYYSINVNQSTSGIVGYADSKPASPSVTVRRAQTEFTAFDYPVTYKWARVASAKALGGYYVRDGSGGATATATLKLASTSEASLVLWRGPSQGIADISVATKAGSPVFGYTIDTYRTRGGQLNASLGSLTAGTYKVTVTATGNKNAASAGTFVGVDGVIANGKTTATPKLVAMWPNYPGEYAYDFTKGTSVSLKFRGTGIEWTALVGPNNGFAKVTIDGVVVDAARDLYAPGYQYQTFTYDGLSENGYHTIVITTRGTKQAASSDTVVTIKALTVL